MNQFNLHVQTEALTCYSTRNEPFCNECTHFMLLYEAWEIQVKHVTSI